MTGKNQPDDPRREPDDTAEFDVIPLFTADLNGHDHAGDYPGGRRRSLVWMGGSP